MIGIHLVLLVKRCYEEVTVEPKTLELNDEMGFLLHSDHEKPEGDFVVVPLPLMLKRGCQEFRGV